METRYKRNIGQFFTEELQQKLLNSKVLVIGCGGVGGFLLEIFARLGVGNITAYDGDIFVESNLNRQLYSKPEVIGKSKVETVGSNLKQINPSINYNFIHDYFGYSPEDYDGIINYDYIFWAGDQNINTDSAMRCLRRALENSIPIFSSGTTFNGISVFSFVKDEIGAFDDFTKKWKTTTNMSVPCYYCMMAASMVANEFVNYILNDGKRGLGQKFDYNMKEHKIDIFDYWLGIQT